MVNAGCLLLFDPDLETNLIVGYVVEGGDVVGVHGPEQIGTARMHGSKGK